MGYGNFITAVLNFLITAFVIFVLVKLMNGISDRLLKKKEGKEETEAPTTKTCPYCRSTIAIEAVRCPNCTSVLEDKEEEAEGENVEAAV